MYCSFRKKLSLTLSLTHSLTRALMTARWIHATPSHRVKSRPQTECPASGKEKAGGQRPGRAQGTKPPRAASTQKGKQPVRKSRAETQKAKAIKGKPRGNRTGRQARNRPQARNKPSISVSGTRRIFAKAPSVRGPPGQAREELGALFQQSLPC